MISDALRKFFSIKTLLGKQEQVGPLPDEKTMYGSFLYLAWPSVVESVLVALVGMVDTIMVAALGDDAIVSVGITQQPKFVMMCFFFAMNAGITAVVARRKGQGDRDGANQAMRLGLTVGIGLIVLVYTLGATFAEPFLRLAGAKDEYIDFAMIYFKYIAISVIFQALNVMINAAQKGSGNTRISMTSNVAGNLINILFNYLLINGIGPFPRLEIEGAAIATLIGAICGMLISLSKLLHRNNYISLLYKVRRRPAKDVLSPIVKVAGSAFVEQICIRFGFFVFNRIVADLDTLSYATHIACQNFLSLSFCFGDGFQVAATSLAGQSLGAKRPDRAYVFCGIGQRVVLLVAIFLSTMFILLRYQIIGLYSDTPEVIEMGGKLMLLMALITYIQTSQVIYNGCLRGAGDTKYTARISLISIAAVRPIAGYLLTYTLGGGLIGAWISILLDQFMRLFLGRRRIKRGKWLQIEL